MSISYNISPWDSSVFYAPNSVVSLNGLLYFSRLGNQNQIPTSYSELQIGFDTCVWSANYFFWIPAYSSSLNPTDLSHRFNSPNGFTLIKNEKANKENLDVSCIFDKRSDMESAAILEFIRYKQGAYSFYFSPQNPYNNLNKYVGRNCRHNFIFYNNNTIEIDFKLIY